MAAPKSAPVEVALDTVITPESPILADAVAEPAPEPRWVRVTVPDYPNVTHLLFHDDGRVTWK